jgi:hypothetical protein
MEPVRAGKFGRRTKERSVGRMNSTSCSAPFATHIAGLPPTSVRPEAIQVAALASKFMT